MTCICYKLLKHFLPLVSLQKSRHITQPQQTRPKTTTWHFRRPALPPSWQRERGGGKKKMTAALDLTSNAGERVRKREGERRKKNGYISAVTACWKSPANAERFLSCSLSFLSIHLSLSVSLSLIKTCRRLGSRQATRFGWDVKNTRRTQGVKRQD